MGIIAEPPGQLAVRPVGANDPAIRALGLSTRDADMLARLMADIRSGNLPSFRPLLPLLFHIQGKPVSLKNREPFEIMFRTTMPRVTVMQCGRQVSKSQTEAFLEALLAGMLPYFLNLYITPLFEMTRRFSKNYMGELIRRSPCFPHLVDRNSSQNILERTFRNGSSLTYTFAYLDDTRTRGIPAKRICYDEYQHFNKRFVPTINAVLSADPEYRLESYQGTPLGPDNSLNEIFRTTTQSHWTTKCREGGCNHYNVAAWDRDLEKMLGNVNAPVHDDVGPNRPGTVCAKCQKPLDCRNGFWAHDYPQLRDTRLGIHVPQPILGIHSHVRKSWVDLLYKVRTYPRHSLLNEVMGEAADAGTKLVSVSDLKRAACLPWKNIAREARKHTDKYVRLALGVDWGGTGGADPSQPRTSFTTVAASGLRPDGGIDVLWGHRFRRALDYAHEVRVLAQAMTEFRASDLAHDYGTGGQQEHILISGGLDVNRLMAVRYVGPMVSKAMIVQKPPSVEHPRTWYALQRTASLALICYCIRTGLIRFFEYDYKSADEPGLLSDFLALDEQTLHRRTSGDLKLIGVSGDQPDDFAHAVNLSACALWFRERAWPDLAKVADFFAPSAIRAKDMDGEYDYDLVDWDQQGTRAGLFDGWTDGLL